MTSLAVLFSKNIFCLVFVTITFTVSISSKLFNDPIKWGFKLSRKKINWTKLTKSLKFHKVLDGSDVGPIIFLNEDPMPKLIQFQLLWTSLSRKLVHVETHFCHYLEAATLHHGQVLTSCCCGVQTTILQKISIFSILKKFNLKWQMLQQQHSV